MYKYCLSQKSLQFQVRACVNARVLLSDQAYGTVPFYLRTSDDAEEDEFK